MTSFWIDTITPDGFSVARKPEKTCNASENMLVQLLNHIGSSHSNVWTYIGNFMG